MEFERLIGEPEVDESEEANAKLRDAISLSRRVLLRVEPAQLREKSLASSERITRYWVERATSERPCPVAPVGVETASDAHIPRELLTERTAALDQTNLCLPTHGSGVCEPQVSCKPSDRQSNG